MAVAVTDRLFAALIAAAAEELADLVLQRLLQDQPGTETADRLDRVLLAADTLQHLIQLAAKPLARGYLLHAGVPPSLGLVRTKRRLRPQLQIPRLVRRDPRMTPHRYLICIPLMARAITSCWISAAASEISGAAQL